MAWKTLVNEVGFLAQHPFVGLAIADNLSPIPGYLYNEINSLTYVENGAKCEPLVGFLVAQLHADLPQVSLKVLKMLLYLVKNGHREVIDNVRIEELALKKATGFHGPADEFHGHNFYESIRTMAKELLEIVFDDNAVAALSINSESQISGANEMAGYGSSSTTKKLPGFGYNVKTPKTVSEKVTDGFTSIVDKFLRSTDIKEEESDRQASYLAQSLPKYKPITIDKSPQFISESETLISTTTSTTAPCLTAKRNMKVRKVGKPGGGWSDSDDEEENSEDIKCDDPSKNSTVSFDSLENGSKLDLQSGLEWVDEHQIINEFCINEPLTALQCDNISSNCKRCSSLNCDKILAFLIDKLSEKEENIKLRALLFIEYLLHSDIVTVESLVRIVLPSLQSSTPEPKSVHMKSKKICLIIQSLHNYQQDHLQTPKMLSRSSVKCVS